jgi:hypothetical protein
VKTRAAGESGCVEDPFAGQPAQRTLPVVLHERLKGPLVPLQLQQRRPSSLQKKKKKKD